MTSSAELQQLIKIAAEPGSLDVCAVEGLAPLRAFMAAATGVRLGGVELGLDCLRRYLQRLPVTEPTDFERV